ncbi:FAD-dependent oxidoreductase [Sphingobium nicotianae]|uniref:FAD-dependent oxidoreductase n=1 Tax=Sphingobium nicotianae TaxID=2782607 RepID=A0A9X1DB85_9SPHN|nr:FAD-dependent oxidoreductase [Sphingobium nicotianae]MBT2186757.1 FAD-dependent oxidoreductase [Sphingobium nicotianae]
MRHIAIIGSGPAGYYTAEACQKEFGEAVQIDIIDRLPVPFGLIRSGVAPDHQSIKAVSRRYEAVALTDNVRFVGKLGIGQDVSIPELLALYDAVVLATGAPSDKPLGVPGDDLPGVIGSAAFVGWYNGHPDFAELAPAIDGADVVIIGNGNVALDCARILAKSAAEFEGSDIVGHAHAALTGAQPRSISILGRRGPQQIAMTPKELGELGHLERASVHVDPADLPPPESDAVLEPGQRKSVALLREFARTEEAKALPVRFTFFVQSVRVEGNGHAERLIVERTQLGANGEAVGTGEIRAIPADMIISCIGYRTSPIPDVPYDEQRGRFANVDGRIQPGLYCVGWARRGPTGTIGTNKPDGFLIAEEIARDQPQAAGKQGRAGLDALIAARGLAIVTFREWQKIDLAEIERARAGSPREKFVRVEDMVTASRG